MSNGPPPTHPPHPEFGDLLVMRNRRGLYIFVAILLGVPGLLLIPGAIGCLLSTVNSRSGSAGIAVLMFALSALLAFGCWFCIRRARTSYWFYQLGALCSRGRRHVAIAYCDADRFQFAVTHQHHEGMHATVLKLRLLAPDNREITFRLPLKVKRSGGFIKPQFEVTDELEGVRPIIARQMAVSLVDRILQGETIEWGTLYLMSSEGLTIVKGNRKGELFPYLAFVGQGFRNGYLHLFPAGESTSVGGLLSTSPMNFWPCYFAFLELTGMLQAVEEESAANASVDTFTKREDGQQFCTSEQGR